MSSGKRSGFEDWDKTETRSHDVGLGLRLQQQQQQQQQQQHPSEVYSTSGEGLTSMTFTTNQRQELERQTMIYKYIMSSLPVPPELIVPLSKYPSSPNLPPLLQHTIQSSSRKGLESRYNGGGRGVGRGGGGDPEPWRCRRTDGKKWRCSRDVTPDQKYCERHSHKGRPSARSRKPVESSLVSSTSTNTTTTTTTTTSSSSSNPITLNPFHYLPSSYDSTSSIPLYNNHLHSPSLRFPEWFMKEEAVVPTAQVLYPQQIEQFAADNRGHSHTSHFSPMNSPSDRTTPRSLPRPFIDAWSLEDVHKVANTNLTLPTKVSSRNKCTNTSSSMNTILPLTLSMSAGFDHNNCQNNSKDEDSVADRGIRSWINLPSGGPLAEALCLGISGTNNVWGSQSDELVSPQGHSTSSNSTTMSSKGSHASSDFGSQGFHLQ